MANRIRIKKRGGYWKVYLVYFAGTPEEYEVHLERFSTLPIAHNNAQTFAKALA